MAEPIPFGRRAPPAVRTPQPAAPLQPTAAAQPLSPEAEAFRARMAAEHTAPPSFSGWLRAQQARRAMAWLLTFALLSPGVLCFIYKTPTAVSGGLEFGGIALNIWLRRERRKHLKNIVQWDEDGSTV